MRSTILSENQYDAKLVPTANRNPNIRPPAPPSACPIIISSALIVPNSSAVLTVLFICSYQLTAISSQEEQLQPDSWWLRATRAWRSIRPRGQLDQPGSLYPR